ncbi:hypothetical protein P22_3822 [Propionispora sp. 2/2-37]|uniref:PTS sugar transporter subunit IIA n=1 Tax=Propionispora sp. 2/2-37 TaxID=1677858 RepID=UPI0006BB59BE|nr:PTS sugar transporter subunit IIA [Propionispora sp. 2/2-37]CUH97687.1 hypothetical protein P22_3822 [Propionispora sp. 2/2-37]
MLSELLTPEVIRLNVECRDWEEALRTACDLLLQKGWVEEGYLQAIMHNHRTLGPYMVVAPGIMLAHARPEDGALCLSLSLITLRKAMAFGNITNDPVKLIITLAATDTHSHIAVLTELMELFMNAEDVDGIVTAVRKEEVLRILGHYTQSPTDGQERR